MRCATKKRWTNQFTKSSFGFLFNLLHLRHHFLFLLAFVLPVWCFPVFLTFIPKCRLSQTKLWSIGTKEKKMKPLYAVIIRTVTHFFPSFVFLFTRKFSQCSLKHGFRTLQHTISVDCKTSQLVLLCPRGTGLDMRIMLETMCSWVLRLVDQVFLQTYKFRG